MTLLALTIITIHSAIDTEVQSSPRLGQPTESNIVMFIIHLKIFRSVLARVSLLVICTLQIIPLYTHPWEGRRSITEPISYRLDTWSQYDNPEEGSDSEGDIHENPSSRKTMTTDRRLLWRNGVVHYHVDSLIVNEPAKLAVFDDAIATIEENTCVKFIRIFPKNGYLPRSNWVNVTGNRPGCFSELGRALRGPSILNLDVKRCFKTRGHSLHELLHTLGVYHEHMRPDRDHFINILWENIKDGNTFNFDALDKRNVTHYDLPYDYDSIMHYSMTAFSKDKTRPTIVPLKEQVDIGQRNHLSVQDIKKLVITYKCKKSEDVVYSDTDHSHSDRLEILNLKNSAVTPEEPNAIVESEKPPSKTRHDSDFYIIISIILNRASSAKRNCVVYCNNIH